MKTYRVIFIIVIALFLSTSCSNKKQWEQAIKERDDIILGLQQQLQETQRQLGTCQEDLASAQEALTASPSSEPEGYTPTHYNSVYDVLHEWYSYSTDDGTFKTISENPLHIQIVPTFMQDEYPDINRNDVKTALLEAVYRTFIHTDTKALTVTCTPQLIQNNNGDFETKPLEKYAKTITVSKEMAVKIAESHLNISTLSELVMDQKVGGILITDEWTDKFKMVIYGEDYNTPDLLDTIFSKLEG
jgi:hypothetical protein